MRLVWTALALGLVVALAGCEATVTQGSPSDADPPDTATDALLDLAEVDVVPGDTAILPDQKPLDTVPDVVQTGACQGVGASLSFAQYRQYVAAVACETWERCGVDVPLTAFGERLTRQACEERILGSFPPWDASIAQAVISFDGAAAASCLNDWCAATCDAQFELASTVNFVDPCDLMGPIKGTLAFGEECYLDAECANGGCQLRNLCPGMCDAPCPVCSDLEYCDAANHACTPRLGEGGGCDPGVAGMCAEGFACKPKDDGTGVLVWACGLAGQDGDACASQGDCAADHYCDRLAAPAVCRPRFADGTPCSEDYQCVHGSTCPEWQVNKQCAPVSQLAAPCQSPQDCAAGLRCALDNLPAICQQPKEGDACMLQRECGDGLVCTTPVTGLSPGVCVASRLLAAGAACVDGIDRCAWPTACLPNELGETVCRPPGEHGAPCTAPRECVGNTCEVGACVLPLPTGSPCTAHAQCEGYCAETICGTTIADGLPCAQAATCITGACPIAESCISGYCPLDEGTQTYLCAPAPVCAR